VRALALAVLVAAAGGSAAGATQARNVDLLRAFRAQLPKIDRTTSVPVLLPRSLPLNGRYRVYASGSASRGHWELSLAGAPDCGGANACFVASFEGKRGGRLPWKPNLQLASADAAAYKPISCGGSCSPASLWFLHRGVLYSWQVKDLAPKNTKATFARLAAEAIAAGPR
jgi:hypothetical protein